MLYNLIKNEINKEKTMNDVIIITKAVGIVFAVLVTATVNLPIL